MKKRKKQFLVVTCILLAVAMGAFAVYAAYNGMGDRKGVAVTSPFYFESNVMEALGADGMPTEEYTCLTSSQSVTVANHLNGIYNHFDVTYQVTIEVQFDPADTAEDAYVACIYRKEETDVDLTRITFQKGGVEKITLESRFLPMNQAISESYTFEWSGWENLETDTPPKISVIATPTEPDFMTGRGLGVVLTRGTSVSVVEQLTYGLDTPESGDHYANYAAFVYRISVPSILPAGKESFTLTWRPEKMKINTQDIRGWTVTSQTDADGVLWYSVSFDLEASTEYKFRFYRNYETLTGEDEAATDFFEHETTAAGESDDDDILAFVVGSAHEKAGAP